MKNLKSARTDGIDVQISDATIKHDKYDDSNAFLIVSKLNKEKTKSKPKLLSKPISKSKQKKIQKLREQYIKRGKRKDTLSSLSNDNITTDEKRLMHSISFLQTHGKKKAFKQREDINKKKEDYDVQLKDNDDLDLVDNTKDSTNFIVVKEVLVDPISPPAQNILLKSDNKNNITNGNHSEKELGIKETNSCIDSMKTEKALSNIRTKTMPLAKKIVPIYRNPEIQKMREKLPILNEEHYIMEQVNEHPFVIICGETGSGKTTQVPQFLFEAGYARDRRIGVTEPRRVAATTLSRRVAHELSLGTDEVSYQIRYEGTVTPGTKIKFMTDGVLMKEVENDFLLTDYSVIVVDEAHERSVYTDVLIGLLSRIVPLREKRGAPLKLIIMSATLRIHDFTDNERLFKCHVPVIKIPSKQYPISIHFNMVTPLENYLEETYRKVCKIHNKLPPGGILVFVTGRAEVTELCRKLSQTFPPFPMSSHHSRSSVPVNGHKRSKKRSFNAPQIDLDSYPVMTRTDMREDDGDEGSFDLDDSEPLHVLPFYSLLPVERQNLVFTYYDDDSTGPTPVAPESESSEREGGKGKVNTRSPADPEPVDRRPKKSKRPKGRAREAENGRDSGRDIDLGDGAQKIGPDISPPSTLGDDGCDRGKPSAIVSSGNFKARLCVVATNVAETSITVPGIKYVVDCGLEKRMTYEGSAVPRLSVDWISKSSADQRAGRCGRTGPGHCYRLYSSAVYNDQFQKFSAPEIESRPVEDIVLQMKLLNIDKVENFPFPSPPPPRSIRRAELLLAMLGLMEPFRESGGSIDNQKTRSSQYDSLKVTGHLYEYFARFNGHPRNNGSDMANAPVYVLTQLGSRVANLPLNPRYGKMLAQVMAKSDTCSGTKTAAAFAPDLYPYVIAIIASLSVRELFLGQDENLHKRQEPEQQPPNGPQNIGRAVRMAWAGCPLGDSHHRSAAPPTHSYLLGDVMVLLRAVGASDFASRDSGAAGLPDFCRRYGIRDKAMVEIGKLRAQLRRSLATFANDKSTVECDEVVCLSETKDNEDCTSAEASNDMTPPDEAQIKALRRLVLAGAGFNIAKRIDPQKEPERDGTLSSNGGTAHHDKMAKKPYYQCLVDVYPDQESADNQPDAHNTVIDDKSQAAPLRAYIHPSSVLVDIAPDYVVYQDCFVSSPNPNNSTASAKIYLKTVTDIDPRWLPLYYPDLCQFDIGRTVTTACTGDDKDTVENKMADERRYSAFYYDPGAGLVKCRAPGLFGPHKWELAPTSIEFPYSLEKFKLFAKFFLEGQVFGTLKKYIPSLLLTPSTMLKTWAKLQTKTQSFLNALIKHDIDSKDSLTKVWRDKNPNFLMKEYLEWLPERLHNEVALLWPLDKKRRK